MLSKLFLKIIENKGVSDFLASKTDIVKKTEPQRIYVENIRSFFNIPKSIAKFLCDFAVKEGLFLHRTGYLCKNCQSVIISKLDSEEMSLNLICEKCEIDEKDKFCFYTNDLDTIDIYQLVKSEVEL